MRPLIDRIIQDLPCPDEALRNEARLVSQYSSAHERYLANIAAFHYLEQRFPKEESKGTGLLRVASLNAERLINPEAVGRMADEIGAHVLLLSEVDLGMARSRNRHTVRDLIGTSGEGYLYGVEFVELDLGDADEMRRHAGERNACGLHGNAIVTSLALERPYLIPLEESGRWFAGIEGAQRRIGGRIALAAQMVRAGQALWIVNLHLESKTDPADRQAQVQALLRALDRLAPNEPCIIGGDFNTKALPRGEGERHLLLESPEQDEPLFTDLRHAGFSWADANLACPTQRDGPTKKPSRPFAKLDWFFVRGLAARNPQVVPALDARGRPVSDHEMIAVDIVF